jgi:hypothetical protein
VAGARVGGDGDGVEPGTLIGSVKALTEIMVSGRTMLEDLVRFIKNMGICVANRLAHAVVANRYNRSSRVEIWQVYVRNCG